MKESSFVSKILMSGRLADLFYWPLTSFNVLDATQRNHGVCFVPRTLEVVLASTSARRTLSILSNCWVGWLVRRRRPLLLPSHASLCARREACNATGCAERVGGGGRSRDCGKLSLKAGLNTSQRLGPPPCGRKGFCPVFTGVTEIIQAIHLRPFCFSRSVGIRNP